jgi:hypothetical protein
MLTPDHRLALDLLLLAHRSHTLLHAAAGTSFKGVLCHATLKRRSLYAAVLKRGPSGLLLAFQRPPC